MPNGQAQAGIPGVGNQTNSDGEVRPNGTRLSGDDVTWPKADSAGDACDTDDDNDGMTDAAEASGAACFGRATQPRLLDTDGDHLTDGWECGHGSDPTNPASKSLGGNAANPDIDGDHVPDLWEQRGYNASSTMTDSDGDGCADLVEIASVDKNKTVDDTDRLAVARRSYGLWGPEVVQDYVLDLNKNGFVDDSDRLFVARAALLLTWLPKSCP